MLNEPRSVFNGFGMSRRRSGRRFGSFIAAAATLAGLATAGLVLPAAADTTDDLLLRQQDVHDNYADDRCIATACFGAALSIRALRPDCRSADSHANPAREPMEAD